MNTLTKDKITAWAGQCRNCGTEWPPTPGQNVCPTCHAGPLSRFENGDWVIELQEYSASLLFGLAGSK